jgi:hypothetical protein
MLLTERLTTEKIMKSTMLIAIMGIQLLLAGCETPSYTGSGPFKSVQPQVRTVTDNTKTVYYAAQKALKKMDFVLSKTQYSKGLVVGISNLRDTEVFGAARQFEFVIKVTDLDDGQTEIEVRLFEQSEADFEGSATNRAVAKHGLYDSFFENLEHELKEQTRSGEGDNS